MIGGCEAVCVREIIGPLANACVREKGPDTRAVGARQRVGQNIATKECKKNEHKSAVCSRDMETHVNQVGNLVASQTCK